LGVRPGRHQRPGRFKFRWTEGIPDREWVLYERAIRHLRSAKIPFLLGGGFAFAAYTGRWRDTKDIDLYVEPKDREKAVRALSATGFEDYFGRLPYDRKWIYRSTRSGVIVDIIWAMANQRAQVDASWFAHPRRLSIRGDKLPILPIEQMIWCKLYILQRDRCDWTDLFNLVYAAGGTVDWEGLIERLGEDVPLLQAMLGVYCWLCPAQALELPDRLWPRLGLPSPSVSAPDRSQHRATWLDSRGWFIGNEPPEKKLEI